MNDHDHRGGRRPSETARALPQRTPERVARTRAKFLAALAAQERTYVRRRIAVRLGGALLVAAMLTTGTTATVVALRDGGSGGNAGAPRVKIDPSAEPAEPAGPPPSAGDAGSPERPTGRRPRPRR